jgi:hypothetical protein
MRHCSLRIQRMVSNVLSQCPLRVPCGISASSGPRSGPAASMPALPISVAGEGVLGPCGPRTGNSSGVRPGNSSGLGGSPGSCSGGGTSGRGFPGGLSRGGSDGCPGLIGGSSCGSIGICIYIATLRLSPISGREPVTAAAAILSLAMLRSIAAGVTTALLRRCSSPRGAANYLEPSASMVLLRVLPVSV